MSRRPYGQEGGLGLAGAEPIDRVGAGTGCSQRGFVGACRDSRVGVEHAASLGAEHFEAAHIVAIVNTSELLEVRPARPELDYVLDDTGSKDPFRDCGEAAGPFRMVSSRIVQGKGLMPSEQHGHAHDASAPGKMGMSRYA